MIRSKSATATVALATRVVLLAAVLGTVAALAGCGSSSTTSSTSANSPSPQTGAPNVSLTFQITNTGSVQHELLVFKSDLSASAYPTDADGAIKEDGPGITKVSDGDNLDPGKSQSRDIDLTKPGKYLFTCNLPTHFKQGMFTEVTIK
jgi:uncharacterized cupredoxin-like copper-binding protein